MILFIRLIKGMRFSLWGRSALIGVSLLAILAGFVYAVSTSQPTWLVSNPVPDNPDEMVANGNSLFSNISYTGEWVAFESQATNLTNPADSDGYNDIFLYQNFDNSGTREELITEVTTGANASSYYPTIARTSSGSTWGTSVGGGFTYEDVFDGRYVAFESTSSSFSKFFSGQIDPASAKMDVFLYDRGVDVEDYPNINPQFLAGEGIWAVTPASLTYDLQPPNAPSGNDFVDRLPSTHATTGANAHVAASPMHQGTSVYMRTDVVPRVVFESRATNLVAATSGLNPADPQQKNRQVFVRSGFIGPFTQINPVEIRLLSKNASGVVANGPCTTPVANSSGRFVAMVCKASNLVDGVTIPTGSDSMPLAQVYLLDRDTGNDGYYDEPGGIKWYLVSRVLDPTTGALGAAGNDESWYPSTQGR